jgi:alcohol dehydrogenase (NADP+)
MDKFAIASDGVNPNLVPKKVLYTGMEMPGIGLGTFGSDRFSPEQVAEAVKGAISVGYRHIDCAPIYGNEDLIGEVLNEILQSGQVKREELWINSKVWNDKHDRVIESCKKSLKDLQLDYLDLYLVHWPFPNYHSPGCDVTSRCLDAKPYLHENYMKTWRQMEQLVDLGLVKNIGTSNMTIPKLRLILRDAKIKPACNEMEQHPHFQQPELFQFCLDNLIQPIGFCPIGSPARPDRDKMETDTVDIEDPVVVKIARRLNVHPAVVCVKWAVQRGQVPIPFSIYRNEYLSNLESTVKDPLMEEEMKEIAKIDKNCRLIKGQVFLWKENQRWEDLWDVKGEITLP